MRIQTNPAVEEIRTNPTVAGGTLEPLVGTIVASVRRINRLVAVHEGSRFGVFRCVGDLS